MKKEVLIHWKPPFSIILVTYQLILYTKKRLLSSKIVHGTPFLLGKTTVESISIDTSIKTIILRQTIYYLNDTKFIGLLPRNLMRQP